jgi:hypothetical protein
MEAIVGNLSLLFFFKTLVMKESCLLKPQVMALPQLQTRGPD